jgi:uncharacterized protein YndB with AHSA1/START domain
MPLKKDGTGKRWVEMELVVPGTPEQVWQAIATGPGYAAWFSKAEIEPRVGGVFRLDFGQGAITTGVVERWEPPHQFAYVERDWEAGAPPVATEITVTSRSGERCLVRMVHSLFTSADDWDDQIEGFERGWPGFFEVLRIYLGHFPGSPAASLMVQTPSNRGALAAWSRLCEALGLSGANVGERRVVPGPEAWSGIVEHVHQDSRQRFAVVRLDAPSAGVALAGIHERDGSVSASLCLFVYGEGCDARAAELEPGWRSWLTATFDADQ